ncbi:MAG: endonuclease Q family protein [Methanomicrobiaceae archaeon]|nr:endonuclease Q family protein [Methanomicrobiaceae archaeon]
MQVNADLHIHSCFSIATSRQMRPAALIEGCLRKGIDLLGSGDGLHPGWRKMWVEAEGAAEVQIIPTAEVEGAGRIHHLIIMEHFADFEELARVLDPYSTNISSAGRPFVSLDGGRLAAKVHDLGGLIGPAHAFTPWTGMYGRVECARACYGEEHFDFLELGLSADTGYGDAIPELKGIPFLSSSDAHSPFPGSLGREFTRLDLGGRSGRDVLESVCSGRIVMNAGFFPEQGKYNRTACTRCFARYLIPEAVSHGWTCPSCGGRIKKGVFDRARELALGEPSPRPPYCHIIPLIEIVRLVAGTRSPRSARCQRRYEALIASLGPEIQILIDRPLDAIARIDHDLSEAIGAFRKGEIEISPGGGGQYGSLTLPKKGN